MTLSLRRLAALPTIAAALAPALLSLPQTPAPTTEPAAAQASASPFLWRIEGNGTTGFLYGTIHLPDPRVVALSTEVEEAFDGSDMFFAEIEATAASELEVHRASQLDGDKTLDELVGASTWARIEKRFADAKLALITPGMKGSEPWAVSAMMPMLDYVPDLMAGKAPLDKALFQRAQKAGKTVGGLETVAEQIAAFEAFDRTQQIQMLRESLDLLDRYEAEGRSVMEETVVAWLSGDEKQLMSLLDDGFGTDPVLSARAEEELLWKRNLRLADRIADKMTQSPDKTGFFAVGALHMPDERTEPRAAGAGTANEPARKGIVTLLRAKGFRVERAVPAAAVPAGAGR